MTSDELKLKIIQDKLSAWDYMRHLAEATPELLAASGQGRLTNAEAVLKHFKDANLRIEKQIQKWELDNPD